MSSLAQVEPVSAQVLILEDDPKYAKRIEKKLVSFGNISCSAAYDMEQFSNLLKRHPFDATSIDCDLNGYRVSDQALEILMELQPETAKIIFTAYEEERKKALQAGADVFLLKDIGWEVYQDNIRQGVRLGIARRIVKCLKELGVDRLPELSPGLLLDDNSEEMIWERTRQVAVQHRIDGKCAEDLEKLIKRRGWWRVFDTKSFIEETRLNKLRILLEYINATPDDLAAILNINTNRAEALLSGEFGTNTDTVIMPEKMDLLLSVLSYILRLSNYQPELMEHYWNVKNLYKESLNKPSWNESGFAEYLKIHGPSGLMESLYWIRSH